MEVIDEKKEWIIPEKYRELLKVEEQYYSKDQLSRSYSGIYNRVFKRCIDFTIALFAFIALLPLNLIIAALIVAETGFPILYRPQRGGFKGRPFRIFKFRTMVQNADKTGGGTTALNDKRITRVGSFLRKTKLDELLQLINVITGSMALIGPRPELLRYTEQYRGYERYIFNVRPGITDFSSLEFINLDEIVGEQNVDYVYENFILKRKNQLRLKYVAEVSFKTDVQLFVKTTCSVIRKAWYSLLFLRPAR